MYFVSDLSSLVEEFFNIMLQSQWEKIVHHHLLFSHFINNQFSTSEQFWGNFEDNIPIFHVKK